MEHPAPNAAQALAHNIKWSYMDHWSMRSARGWVAPQNGPAFADRFYKAIVGVGFQGVDPFEFRLAAQLQIFGSAKAAVQFAKDRGVEQFVNMFCIGYNENTHLPETHEETLRCFEAKIRRFGGVGLESYVVMPATHYWKVEPVTDEKIKWMAECWNQVGRMTKQHGIKLTCHHEFYCGLHHRDELDKFYAWTDPEYVYLFVDTAQHQISGVDPTDFYLKHHKRVSGFHFKDTHFVDLAEDYRTPPDPERSASTTSRWFWEMGTKGGLVDFPRFMKAMKDCRYKGWASVEHDKADVGGNYAESTCHTKWYIDNVLSKIYA
jgi:inosose dehydratase